MGTELRTCLVLYTLFLDQLGFNLHVGSRFLPPSPASPPPWTRITSSAASPAPATRLRHRSSHLTPPTRTPTGTRRRRHRTLPTPATPTLRNTTTIGGRLPTSSNSPSVILRRCNSSSTGINSLPRRLRYSSSRRRLLLGTPGLLTTPPASLRRLATLLRRRGRLGPIIHGLKIMDTQYCQVSRDFRSREKKLFHQEKDC